MSRRVERRPRPPSRSGPRFALFGLAALSLAGCGLLLEPENPDQIRLLVESTSSQDVELVLGDRFFLGGTDEEGQAATVTLVSADTVPVSPPYDRSFDLAPSFQFYVQALPDSSATPREIRIQVFVDGDSRYDKSGTLGEEDFEFVYNFN